MLPHLSKKEKQQLSKKFKRLRGIEEQFRFWEDELRAPYIIFLFLTSSYHDFSGTDKQTEITGEFQDFIITPRPEQFAEYNKKLVEQYSKHYELIDKTNDLIDIEIYKENYSKKIETLKNKESFMNDRIAFVNQRVYEQKRLTRSDPQDLRHYYFMTGYHAKFFNDEEPDLTGEAFDFYDLISLLNGSAYADFHRFLEVELNSLRSKRKKEISIQLQIMLWHFIGPIENIIKHKKKEDKISILPYLLNKTSQGVKEVLTYEIHTLLTPEQRKKRKHINRELEKIYELLESGGFKEEAAIVRKEIDDLPKK